MPDPPPREIDIELMGRLVRPIVDGLGGAVAVLAGAALLAAFGVGLFFWHKRRG